MKPLLIPFFLVLTIVVNGQSLDTATVRLEIDSLIQLNNKLLKEQKLDEALLVLKAAEEKHIATFGEESALYASITKSIGIVYYYKGDFTATESYWLKTKTIKGKVLGKEHPEYAGSLNNLGVLYETVGQYQKAETAYMEANAIQEKALGKEHPEYAASLINLGNLYYIKGQFQNAEKAYMEAITIQGKALGVEHPNYAKGLNNLGLLYSQMEQYQKAETAYLEATAIQKKALGTEHPEYALSLNNLGLLYCHVGQYQKAETAFAEAKTIEEKVLGKEHPEYAISMKAHGNLYYLMGQYQKAEETFLEAKSILGKVLGKEHIEYAACSNNLGILYMTTEEYQKAEEAYMEAITIEGKVLGKEHPEYAKSLKSMGVLYNLMGEYQKAEPLYVKANTINKNLLLKASLHLSERELLNYINKFIIDQNLLLSFSSKQLTMTGIAFNNSLFYKGFLLNATQQVNRLAQSDSTSHDLFLQLKAYNSRLSRAYSRPLAERDSGSIAELEEKANTLEKELTRSIAGFGQALQQVTWEEIQSTLKAGDAAIEFVHYKLYNPNESDSIMYAALLLLPDEEPQIISLFEEREINDLLVTHQERRADYVNNLYAIEDRGSTVLKQSSKSLYDLIWKPIAPLLEGINKIYFAPSGLLHRINLAAIPVDDEQTLCDQYDLVQVNSTRQLVIPPQNTSIASGALLMGGIEYDIDSLLIIPSPVNTLENKALVTRSEFEFEHADSTLRGGTWNYLKYTEKEVDKIGKLLLSNGYQTDVQVGSSASEELFRRSGQGKTSPRFLHLATHGFFFPDPDKQQTALKDKKSAFKTSDHPMIRSGLILAGGNHVWEGNDPTPGREDGILTAYEISQMDLSNTELVVLSACETGLGDINGNEGVYGLQRAFKIAGAKYLIMSLWQIPDRETKDFMVTFYEHLLEDNMAIPDAFRLTQKEMKDRFYNPYQWAGFVLVE